MAVKKIAQKKAKAVTAASPRAKFNTDFIPTISDSESDVPDLDSDDEEIKKSAEVSAVKTVKSKKVKKDRKNKQNAKSKGTETAESDEDSGQNQTSKDLNPDFIFSVEDLGSTATFDGWDFEINAKDSTDIKKKDVDLDEIIRRKGGLSGKVNINAETEDTNDVSDDDRSNSSEAEFDESNEESNEESDDDVNLEEEQVKLDDDELALDGFGMGAESAKKIEEHGSKEDGDINHVNDVKSDDGGDDDDDDIIDEEGTTDYETIPDQSSDENREDDADSAEAIASYYDQEEGDAAKEQTHKTFQSLQLSRPILKSLASLNYSKPTPIQSASIPIALLGRDIVAGAMTGSGKTAAYIIPIIERLLYKPAKIAKTRVIILTPTRELAIQVADVGRKLGQYVHNLTFGLAVGGLNLRQQEQELKKRPDVVIATPGRLIDHIRNSPSFSVDDVEIVIMDEADRMLEEGFEKEMQEIVELLPRKRQTMLFSATMNSSIKQLIQWSLEKPVRIMIDPPKTAASGLVQEFVRVRKREELKPALLFSVLSKLDQNQRIIVFVSTKDMCHKLRIRLGLLGLRVGELHGGLTQDQRLVSVTLFKKSTVPILLCTDLAARGLDIPKIEVVINFDMPKTHEIYLHRVGRTARAGRDGISISFVGEAKRERAIVREVIKNVEESGNGKAMGRNADWAEVERVNNVLVSKADIIDEIIEEEKQEKQVLAAEMELTKGENLIKYREEIESRPKRTWFMSEKEKKEDKNRVIDALSKTKKLTNSKKRKRAEALADSGNHLRTYTKTGKDRSENDIKRITKSSAKKNGKDKKIGKGKFGKRLRK